MNSSRLLILGESIYSWEEDGEIMHPNLDHSTDVIEWINKNWYAAGRASFLRRVTLARLHERAIQVSRNVRTLGIPVHSRITLTKASELAPVLDPRSKCLQEQRSLF